MKKVDAILPPITDNTAPARSGRPMDAVPRLLYVSPVIPSRTGSGLAMRAGRMIELLARRHAVWLLVVPLHGHTDHDVPAEIACLCRAVATLDADAMPRDPFHAALRIDWTSHDALPATWPFEDLEFDIIHAYRLTTLSVARRYVVGNGTSRPLHVDLDEAESASRRRMARVLSDGGHGTAAKFATLEATRCARLELDVIEHSDAVYVCSDEERDALAHAGTRAQIRTVPNVIPVDKAWTVPLARHVGDPFRMLFVGTLAFPANEDAVVHFCRDVMPLVRASAKRRVELVVVGAGASPRLEALASAHDDVTLAGFVGDVAPCYASSDAVVVPLRTGGGARLKVLEAMAHGRPLVATRTGLAGIAAEPDRHVLVGDDAERFAAQCCRLIADPALGVRLAMEAHALVSSAHTIEAAAAALYA